MSQHTLNEKYLYNMDQAKKSWNDWIALSKSAEHQELAKAAEALWAHYCEEVLASNAQH